MKRMTRRRFLQGAAGLLALPGIPTLAGSLAATPRQPAGPFYPPELPLDDDSDLTRVAGRAERAAGRITDLGGRLLDRNGQPLAGLRIEIWQCDYHGRYRHPRDPGERPIDPGFQGIGHAISDRTGRYRFRTIRPVPYPGRTPHIHVAVYEPGEKPFITQLYVEGESRNADDFLYRRVPATERHLVTAAFEPTGDADVELRAAWNIVLGRTPA